MKNLEAGGDKNRAVSVRAYGILEELKLIIILWLYEIGVYLLYRYNLMIEGLILSMCGIYIISKWVTLECSVLNIVYQDECLLSRWIAIFTMIIGKVIIKMYSLDAGFNIFITYNGLFILSNIQGRYKFKVWKKEEIRGYAKLSSLQGLMNRGLNVHNFLPCRSVEEIMSACRVFNGVCTIRTDKFGVGQGNELKFYVLNKRNLLHEQMIASEIVGNGLIAIVADGLKHDHEIRYNVVYRIYKSGEFVIEYSRHKVPLRLMYKYPEKLNIIGGKLDDGIRYWEKHLAIHEVDRVDLREIRELLEEQYKVCLEKNMFGHYVEMTTYNSEVGIKREDKVYWEVR